MHRKVETENKKGRLYRQSLKRMVNISTFTSPQNTIKSPLMVKVLVRYRGNYYYQMDKRSAIGGKYERQRLTPLHTKLKHQAVSDTVKIFDSLINVTCH